MSQPPPARQLTPPLQAHRDAEQGTTHAHPTCTQCGDRPADYVSLADFHGMMRLTRLQTTIPITGLYSKKWMEAYGNQCSSRWERCLSAVSLSTQECVSRERDSKEEGTRADQQRQARSMTSTRRS
jgi:hypothetical protein